MGENLKPTKTRRNRIPKYEPRKAAAIQRAKTAEILFQADIMATNFQALLKQQSHGKPRKTVKAKRALRPCLFFNWRGCTKGAAECRKAGYEHKPDHQAFEEAKKMAREATRVPWQVHMRLQENIAKYRSAALSASGGRCEAYDEQLNTPNEEKATEGYDMMGEMYEDDPYDPEQ